MLVLKHHLSFQTQGWDEMFHPTANRQQVFTSWNSHGREMSYLLPPLVFPNTKGRNILHEFVLYTDNQKYNLVMFPIRTLPIAQY